MVNDFTTIALRPTEDRMPFSFQWHACKPCKWALEEPTHADILLMSRAGLGGGSHVSHMEGATCAVGPQSVGQHLTRDALCFGGHTCTATDVATVLGRMSIQGSHALPEGVHQQCVCKLSCTQVLTTKHSPQTGAELLLCMARSQKQASSYLY